MKNLLALAVAFACAGFSFAQQRPDPAEGFWLAPESKRVPLSGWEITIRGGILYGKAISAAGYTASDIAVKCKDSYPEFPVSGKVNEMPVLGTYWLFGFQRESPGLWSGGFAIDPFTGKLYKCKIAYHQADGRRYQSETLEMRVEIGFGIGASQYWRRVTPAEAGALK
jgi:uncharacterized protein (DUF2147 family)